MALLVLIAFYVAGLLLRKLTRRIGERADVRNDILVLIGRTGSTFLMVMGVITALGTAG